jgi:hypothetical protein
MLALANRDHACEEAAPRLAGAADRKLVLSGSQIASLTPDQWWMASLLARVVDSARPVESASVLLTEAISERRGGFRYHSLRDAQSAIRRHTSEAKTVRRWSRRVRDECGPLGVDVAAFKAMADDYLDDVARVTAPVAKGAPERQVVLSGDDMAWLRAGVLAFELELPTTSGKPVKSTGDHGAVSEARPAQKPN